MGVGIQALATGGLGVFAGAGAAFWIRFVQPATVSWVVASTALPPASMTRVAGTVGAALLPWPHAIWQVIVSSGSPKVCSAWSRVLELPETGCRRAGGASMR